MSRIAEMVRLLAEPIAQGLSVEIFDVEYLKEGAHWILRVTLDAESGITHSECEALSRALESVLDAQGVIDDAYMLEVSSPGAERPLRSERDFVRFLGRAVVLKTFSPVDGQKEWKGNLLGQVDGTIRLQTPQGDMGFQKDQVSLVRLTID